MEIDPCWGPLDLFVRRKLHTGAKIRILVLSFNLQPFLALDQCTLGFIGGLTVVGDQCGCENEQNR